jgi:lactoylglutathione lyase
LAVITGLGHVAFGVSDLERSLDFYCRGLGLREAFRLYNDRGETWIVYVQVSPYAFLEFFPGSRLDERAAGQSYRHLCLLVDDIAATLAQLAQRGILPDRPARQGKDGNWQAWLTDPDGNHLEIRCPI